MFAAPSEAKATFFPAPQTWSGGAIHKAYRAGNKHITDPQRYTVEQAAAQVGIRADDLASLLPDAGIDIAAPGHDDKTLSDAEVARLTRLFARIKQFHTGLSDIGD